MATLLSSKLRSNNGRERVDMNAPLLHARLGRAEGGAAFLSLDFADGERHYTMSITGAELLTILDGALGIKPRTVALIAAAAKP